MNQEPRLAHVMAVLGGLACALAVGDIRAETEAKAARTDVSERPALLLMQGSAGVNRGGAGEEVPLTDPTYNSKQDSFGFYWNINQQGSVSDNNNGRFHNAFFMRVDGSGFSAREAKMTVDEKEYFLSGRAGRVEISRRVRFDTERGAVRYVDVIKNPDQKNPVTAAVDFVTAMGMPIARTVTSTGKPFNGPGLAKDEVGFLAVAQGNGNANILFLVGDPKAKVRPTIQVQGQRQYIIQYHLALKPGESKALFHVLAYRQAAAGNAANAEKLVELFYKRRLLDPGVPDSLAEMVVNAQVTAGIDGVRLLDAVATTAETYGIERGGQDVLVIDESSSLTGEVACEELSVETAFGKAIVKWDDIAMVVGGQGIGAPMAVHLRNGEILSGPVSTRSMKMTSQAGGSMALEPAKIHILIGRVSPSDDHPTRSATAFLTTLLGDRLAIAGDDDTRLEMVTPWGGMSVAMRDIASLEVIREPQSAHVLSLDDGTRMTVMFAGGALEPVTLRFGKIKVSPFAVVGITPLQEIPEGDEAIAALEARLEAESLAREDSPRVALIGNNILPGTITTPSLHLLGALGMTTVDTRTIKSLTKTDDDASSSELTIEGRKGEKVTGRIEERMLEITSGGRTWLLPTSHVVEAVVPREIAPPAPTKEQARESDSDEESPPSAPGEASRPPAQPTVRELP